MLTQSLGAQPQLRVVSALLSLSPGTTEALLGSFLEAAQQQPERGLEEERLLRGRRRSSGPQLGLRLAEAVALVLSALHMHPQLTWQLATPRLRQWEGAILAVLRSASDTVASEGSVLPSIVDHLHLCMDAGGHHTLRLACRPGGQQ